MKFEKKRVLITVKAYPAPSTKYGETVCCAGVDLNNSRLVRLYPIPFRDLDSDQRFRKYSIIEVECIPPKDDKRKESFQVRARTIKVENSLDTDGGTWERRKAIVLKVPIKSMCDVYEDAKSTDLSLGLIKPKDISFEWKKHSLSDQKKRKECYAQLSFFNRKKEAIEEIPFNFYYNFKCLGILDCPGHKLSIIDWEIRQAYRKWQQDYNTKEALLEKIKQQWLSIADTQKKDVYFYVGNMKRRRDIFMVLGVFYPPKKEPD